MRLCALLRAQSHRALLQSAQALPRHRHALRQACEKFPCRGTAGRDYNPAQLKTGPSLKSSISRTGQDSPSSESSKRSARAKRDRADVAGDTHACMTCTSADSAGDPTVREKGNVTMSILTAKRR